jgi:hypothetical protein
MERGEGRTCEVFRKLEQSSVIRTQVRLKGAQ